TGFGLGSGRQLQVAPSSAAPAQCNLLLVLAAGLASGHKNKCSQPPRTSAEMKNARDRAPEDHERPSHVRSRWFPQTPCYSLHLPQGRKLRRDEAPGFRPAEILN